jgi:spore germination protein GerM
MRMWAAVVAMVGAGCSHQTQPAPTPQVTVYFCKAGTDALVPMPFSTNRQLQGAKLESALIAQLLSGPAVPEASVVLFPQGTIADVDLNGDMVVVNFRGALAKPFRGGDSDEIALFKSLTYTATSVPGVKRVQVLIDRKKVPTLPGGQFEIDEPLTRETFSQ